MYDFVLAGLEVIYRACEWFFALPFPILRVEGIAGIAGYFLYPIMALPLLLSWAVTELLRGRDMIKTKVFWGLAVLSAVVWAALTVYSYKHPVLDIETSNELVTFSGLMLFVLGLVTVYDGYSEKSWRLALTAILEWTLAAAWLITGMYFLPAVLFLYVFIKLAGLKGSVNPGTARYAGVKPR